LGDIFVAELFGNSSVNTPFFDQDPTFSANSRPAAGGVDMDSKFHGGAEKIISLFRHYGLVVRLKNNLMFIHRKIPLKRGKVC
jgi:hypothetical protein